MMIWRALHYTSEYVLHSFWKGEWRFGGWNGFEGIFILFSISIIDRTKIHSLVWLQLLTSEVRHKESVAKLSCNVPGVIFKRSKASNLMDGQRKLFFLGKRLIFCRVISYQGEVVIRLHQDAAEFFRISGLI